MRSRQGRQEDVSSAAKVIMQSFGSAAPSLDACGPGDGSRDRGLDGDDNKMAEFRRCRETYLGLLVICIACRFGIAVVGNARAE